MSDDSPQAEEHETQSSSQYPNAVRLSLFLPILRHDFGNENRIGQPLKWKVNLMRTLNLEELFTYKKFLTAHGGVIFNERLLYFIRNCNVSSVREWELESKRRQGTQSQENCIFSLVYLIHFEVNGTVIRFQGTQSAAE